jgi:predicted ATPase
VSSVGIHHQYRREVQAVHEQTEAAITLSTEQGFTQWVGRGILLQGWALAEQGQGEAGISQIRQGLAAYQATGGGAGQPYWLALLAEAYSKVGQVEEGLTVLTEALATVDKTGERFYEAELYRLKGELLLARAGYRI